MNQENTSVVQQPSTDVGCQPATTTIIPAVPAASQVVPKRPRGRPKGSTKLKKLEVSLPPVPVDASPQVKGLAPYRWQPGQSGNPEGRPKTRHTRQAILKIIAEAQAAHKKDPLVNTRWEQLMRTLYDRALDEDIKVADLILIMNFLRDGMGEKPSADTEDSGNSTPQVIINIENTRFGKPPIEDMDKANVINLLS